MKAGTTAKPKFLTLCRVLEMPRWQAVGLLQTLWDLTADHAPRGNVGKLSDEEIADYFGVPVATWRLWCGALVDCHWLVRDDAGTYDAPGMERFRLVVHHWHEHCEQRARRRVERAREQFASVIIAERREATGTDLYAGVLGTGKEGQGAGDAQPVRHERSEEAAGANPVKALIRAGVTPRKAQSLVKAYTIERIWRVIEWAEARRPRNAAGLIIHTLDRHSNDDECTNIGSVVRNIAALRYPTTRAGV